MRADDFDYLLPESAIAQHPVEPRSAARMLVDIDASGDTEHVTVEELPRFVRAGDVVVVNETRVLPARLPLFKATGGAAEVFLLEIDGTQPDGRHWTALVRPGRRLPPGAVLFDEGGTAVVEIGAGVAGDDEGRRQVRLLADLGEHGTVPLPPYIHEPLADPERYQTVYARTAGSVAAPTAGLHLTDEVLDGIRSRDVGVHTVDLAVGLGTFRPITVDDLGDHTMHEERYAIPESTLDACRRARADGGRVIAVGTTTVRALESAAARNAVEGRTDLFIQPGFAFQLVDVLLTNFHLPKSSLLVMLSAFAGHERWQRLYEIALAEGYRFLSFGDCMLVSRQSEVRP